MGYVASLGLNLICEVLCLLKNLKLNCQNTLSRSIERIMYNKNTTIEEYVVSVILEKADQDFRRIVKPFSFYW